MVETQLAEDASVRRPPSPRGQRAVGPQASEGITRIGEGNRHRGRGRGRRGHRHRGQAAAPCPDGGSHRPGQGGAVGEDGRGSREGERACRGERAGAYRRDRLGRRCGLGAAVGRGRRGAAAGWRGRVGSAFKDEQSACSGPRRAGKSLLRSSGGTVGPHLHRAPALRGELRPRRSRTIHFVSVFIDGAAHYAPAAVIDLQPPPLADSGASLPPRAPAPAAPRVRHDEAGSDKRGCVNSPVPWPRARGRGSPPGLAAAPPARYTFTPEARRNSHEGHCRFGSRALCVGVDALFADAPVRLETWRGRVDVPGASAAVAAPGEDARGGDV